VAISLELGLYNQGGHYGVAAVTAPLRHVLRQEDAVHQPDQDQDDSEQVEKEEKSMEQAAAFNARKNFNLRVSSVSADSVMLASSGPISSQEFQNALITNGQVVSVIQECYQNREAGITSCPVVDAYTTETQLEIVYDRTVFIPRPPTVQAVYNEEKHSTLVEIQRFAEDPDSMTASFTLFYHCDLVKERQGTIYFSLFFDILGLDNITVWFAKRCLTAPGVTHPYTHLFSRYPSPNSEKVELLQNLRGADLPLLERKNDSGSFSSLTLELDMHRPGTIYQLGYVSVTSHPEIRAYVVGMPNGRILTIEEPIRLQVLFSCLNYDDPQTLREFHVKIEMPPFEPLSAGWSVVCVGEPGPLEVEERRVTTDPLSKLNIGTLDFTKADIMRAGVVQSMFNISQRNILEPELKTAELKTLDERRSVFEVSIWPDSRNVGIDYTGITISVQPPRILAASVEYPSVWSFFYMPADGGSIIDLRKLRIRMICKEKGKAMVLASILLKGGSVAEFGFQKQCREPQIYQQKHAWTAGGVMGWLFFACFLLFIWFLRIIYMMRFTSTEARGGQHNESQFASRWKISLLSK